MAELVDAADSKSVFERSGSSSLPRGTILKKDLEIQGLFFRLQKSAERIKPSFSRRSIVPSLSRSAQTRQDNTTLPSTVHRHLRASKDPLESASEYRVD